MDLSLNVGQGASTGGLSYKGLQLYHNYKTDATDKSPKKSNHGVMYTGRSLAFDGSNDYVRLDGLKIDGNQMTFALWLKAGGTATQREANNSYLFDFNTNRTIFGWIGGSEQSLSLHTAGSWSHFGDRPDDGSWHRVVFSINNTTAQCFVDGVQLGSDATITAIDLDLATESKLGASYSGQCCFFNGELSNVSIWDKALSADVIAYDYNNPQASITDIANQDDTLDVSNCKLWLALTEGA